MNTRLDRAVQINVTGPLMLLRLAESCPGFQCFCQVSTCYALMDKKDPLIEEKLMSSAFDWSALYAQVQRMTLLDIEHYAKNMMATFPNSYVFTKRMAEHLLVENNAKGLPLYIVRPSIIGAALTEPFPGWTDSIGLAGGLYLLAGLGLLRELPGDPRNIGDIVPVDLVSN